MIVLEAHLLSCFAGVNSPLPSPQQMEDVSYLLTPRIQPQASRNLRTENLNPCVITISQLGNPAQADHSSCDHRPHPTPTSFLKCFAETLQAVQGYLGLSHPSRCPTLQLTFLCSKCRRFSLFGLTVCLAHELVLTGIRK